MPSSKKLVEIARILKQEGYIAEYVVTEGDPQDTLEITLKYGAREGAHDHRHPPDQQAGTARVREEGRTASRARRPRYRRHIHVHVA